MINNSKTVIENFIEEIWNQRRFDKAENFLAPDYKDFSLPPILTGDKAGTITWIKSTSKAFEHQTSIEEMVAEEDKVMVKITMQMKHIGVWRAIEPTKAKVSVSGFRYFKLHNGKIIEHWGLIDGNALENKLREVQHGCSVAM